MNVEFNSSKHDRDNEGGDTLVKIEINNGMTVLFGQHYAWSTGCLLPL